MNFVYFKISEVYQTMPLAAEYLPTRRFEFPGISPLQANLHGRPWGPRCLSHLLKVVKTIKRIRLFWCFSLTATVYWLILSPS